MPLLNTLEKSTYNLSGFDFKEGVMILVDKPLNWTSFDVVNKIRYKLKYTFNYKKIKVGHAGTLDPLATGLLIVCTGKYTKMINEIQGQDKRYTGTIKLGATTPTYDLESQEDQHFSINHITDDNIQGIVPDFLGDQMQTPPIFSAIKVNGQAAYKLARRGDDVKLKERPITIHQLELNRNTADIVSFVVACSKGTYIRSLAHDIGGALQSGGYLTSLKRVAIGKYLNKEALSLRHIIEKIDLLGAEIQ